MSTLVITLPEEDALAHWRGVQLHDRLLGVDVAQLGGLAGQLESLNQLILKRPISLYTDSTVFEVTGN